MHSGHSTNCPPKFAVSAILALCYQPSYLLHKSVPMSRSILNFLSDTRQIHFFHTTIDLYYLMTSYIYINSLESTRLNCAYSSTEIEAIELLFYCRLNKRISH